MALTPAQQRAAELARIKAENEARKTRVSESRGQTPVATPTPTSAPAAAPLTPTQQKAVESAVVRAISGGTEADVAAAVQTINTINKTAPSLSQQMTNKEVENIVVRAISGGTDADVTAAVQAVEALNAPVGPSVSNVLKSGESVVSDGPTGPSNITGSTGPTNPTGPFLGTQPVTPSKKYRASDGREFDSEEALLLYEERLAERAEAAAKKETGRVSAFKILGDEFRRYGFDDPEFFRELEGLIRQDLSDSEIRIGVRRLPAYERRFGAIKRRIDKGFNAISEAAFLDLEDAYASTMRQYGLPESYYVKQPGRTNPIFENLIELNISAPELEERLMLGQKRVMQAPPEVLASIRDFYGDSVTNGDILAFVVDPKNAIEKIKTKVTAAEIGAGARQAGLGLGRERAEELGRFGVTGEQARAGFQQIAGGVGRGGQLAAIYEQLPYGQEVAEREIFGTTGAPEARKRRQKLIRSEEAAFGGQTGLTGGALSRDRAGSI